MSIGFVTCVMSSTLQALDNKHTLTYAVLARRTFSLFTIAVYDSVTPHFCVSYFRDTFMPADAVGLQHHETHDVQNGHTR